MSTDSTLLATGEVRFDSDVVGEVQTGTAHAACERYGGYGVMAAHQPVTLRASGQYRVFTPKTMLVAAWKVDTQSGGDLKLNRYLVKSGRRLNALR